jgi:hypothetical protein
LNTLSISRRSVSRVCQGCQSGMVRPPAFVRSLRFVAGADVYMLNASCTAIAVPLLCLAAFSTFHRLSWYSPTAAALFIDMMLRHEVAKLIVWHVVSTRPVVPSTVSHEPGLSTAHGNRGAIFRRIPHALSCTTTHENEMALRYAGATTSLHSRRGYAGTPRSKESLTRASLQHHHLSPPLGEHAEETYPWS